MKTCWFWPATLLALGGCASLAPTSPPSPDPDWHAVSLPGKAPTQYELSLKEGRWAIAARSSQSASMWRRKLQRAPEQINGVRFSWWVQDVIADASVADASREDAPARVMFGFDGNHATLPARTRLMLDLAEALTGEKPPYATLMYVWDAQAPVGTVIVNPRSDRIRKIVVDSGDAQLRRWREHRRDLAADFRLAFGEAPGTLLSVALMTDSDNTRSQALSWYGPVVFD
jgi:hypothetical protein